MKTAGFYVMIFGIALTAYTGFKYVTHEKVAKIGDLEIVADKTNHVQWSPMLGVAVIVIGGIMHFAGRTRK
jgi:hypothetical protein